MPREIFHAHFQRSFFDPSFDAERDAIARLEAIAWDAYEQERKAPVTAKAGPEFADPDYDLSVEWRNTRDALMAAEAEASAPVGRERPLDWRGWRSVALRVALLAVLVGSVAGLIVGT